MNMKKLLKLRAQREDLRLKAMAILNKADAESRCVTKEEREEIDKIETEIKDFDEHILRVEVLLSLEPSAKDSSSEPPSDNDAEPKKEENSFSDKTKAVRQNPQADEKRFSSFGQQLMAVYRSASPGGKLDERLSTRAASGLNESNPSDGGFLVQHEYVTELLKKTFETGILAPKARRIPISTNANGLKINAVDDDSRGNGCRWGGVQAYWESEASELSASSPKFRQIDLSLKKLTGLCYATDELLQDALALEAVINQAFAEEFAFKIDDAILSGSGAGQPLGILKSKATVLQALENGQSEKITVENLVKMWARLWARSRANSVWYINQELEPLLYLLKVGDKPVYIPAGGLSEHPYGTLFGRPVVPLEQCSALGEVGDIILADLSQYLLIDKGGINATSSIHVRFIYDENVFRFIYRADGTPIWSKQITPYKGSNTLSPFVTLAKRA